MAVAEAPFLAPVLLLISLGLSFSSVLPECPEPCTCQSSSLLNCSSSGITLLMQHIPDSVTELDLSHNLLDSITLNRPHHNLQNVWLGSNRITRLSLCMEGNLGTRTRSSHRFKPWSRRRCVSWAPVLQVLSAERNQLEQLPEGLNGSESLRVLQLSFNRISTLQPRDLNQLPHLTELHLQHNLIASLHPQMFQDLTKLRVLDLSFNRLTNLHPLMYGSLRNIGTDVRLHGNRWHCDCTMRTLRRRMTYDSIRGLQVWDVVCAHPSILVGRDLLQLEEDELNCFGAENRADLHQDVTVYSGSKILLSCSSQDSLWLTPSGEPSVTQLQAGLLITDITDKDAGLYVCTSEEDQVVSVYNLQISKTEGAKRRIRSLSRASQQIIPYDTSNTKSRERNQRQTKSELILAVCLSVFVTFLLAFVLGVLARPCIDGLLRRVAEKRNSSETSAESTTEERQYDNEAFSNGEEPEVIIHRERRVTFSTVDFKEHTNVQYDTVVNGGQETLNNDAVIECETNVDSGGGNDSQLNIPEKEQKEGRDHSGVAETDCPHNTQFEHIQDPVEQDRRRSLSSCSDSSLSDKVCDKDQNIRRDRTAPKSPQLVEDSVLQRTEVVIDGKAEVSQTSTESREDHIFSSEPFADWSPNRTIDNLTDPDLWQENEEQFEFDDSFRSTSERSSSVCVFNNSNLMVTPMLDKEMKEERRKRSSSSSCVSEVDPTEYSVNSEKEKVEQNHSQPQFTNILLKQDAGFRNQTHGADPSVGFNGSSPSSDSDGEDYRGEVKALPPTKKKVSGLVIARQRKSLDRITSPPAADPSSSSSESEEDEGKGLKAELSAVRVNEQNKINERETFSTDLDSRYIPQIKAPSAASNPSSSDDSMDETTKHSNRQEREDVIMNGLPVKENLSVSLDANEPQWPSIELSHVSPTKRLLDIKSPSSPIDSSSSSESDNGTSKDINMQDQGQMHKVTLATKESPTLGHDPQTQWPVINLEDSIRIKRRLDINARSLASVSSSISDSDEETTGHTEKPSSITVETTSYSEKQRLVKLDNAGLQFQVFQTESHDSGKSWPVLDLENSTRIKKRLDIKAPTHSDSSSSSDNEDETTSHIKKQKPIDKNMSKHPTKVSPTTRPQTRWPVLNLENSTRIKRRLDIKAPLPDSDSSSSSDSEHGTTSHIKKQKQIDKNMSKHPTKVSPTTRPQTRWPVLNLENSTRIKKRLDIKAPTHSDSSSSSDNEDETTSHIKKQKPIDKNMSKHPTKVSPTTRPQTRWPVLNLENSTRIKRRLDIKAPLPDSDSSSSSDSEHGTTSHIKKQKQIDKNMSKHPTKVSPTTRPQTRWPVLNLENSTRIKKRLDIKAPTHSDSSSSSDNEDETTSHIKKQKPIDKNMSKHPTKVSPTTRPQTRWPVLNLENSTRIKRRLDIKAPLPDSDSSSSSDSEHGTTSYSQKQRLVKLDNAGLQFQVFQTESHDSGKSWPVLDLENSTRIKKRLDIKAPTHSDSSSSSDSEDETTSHIKKQKQIDKNMSKHPTKVSPTTRPQTRWPVLNLENSTRIKRRLDIKAPLPDSDSSSSSDSEHGTNQIEKHRPGKVDIDILQTEGLQLRSQSKDKRRSGLDLDYRTPVKRRLDIKATSPDPDSSSSSDSEDGKTSHIKKQKPIDKNMSKHPTKVSPTTRPQTQWPVLNLENSTRIKRRLDIKAPLPDSDSSSSSDSEHGTTSYSQKQRLVKLDNAGLQFQVSQTESHDSGKSWPVLDLENSTRIKKRLDIKAPTHSDSSSSSDSEHGTNQIEKHRPGKVDIDILQTEGLQLRSQSKDKRRSGLHLEYRTPVKRRLDIKATSPDPDSSSSSDSEHGRTHDVKKEEQRETYMPRIPAGVSQTVSQEPQSNWPALNLEDSTRVKRRLDIIVKSINSDSCSSSDSADETGKIKKQSSRWPVPDLVVVQGLGRTTHIKTRVDIKPPDCTSSSGDSESETTHQSKKERSGLMESVPFREYQTEGSDPQSMWPVVDLSNITHVRRRLDIKVASPHPDLVLSAGSMIYPAKGKRKTAIQMSHRYLSSSSDDEEEEGMEDLRNAPTTVEIIPDSRWPKLSLNDAPNVKRRLDIRVRSPSSDSSSSESEVGIPEQPVKVERDRPNIRIAGHQPGAKPPDLSMSIPLIKRHLNIKAPVQQVDPCSSSSNNEGRVSRPGVKYEINKGDLELTDHEQQKQLDKRSLGDLYPKKRLDIKGPSPQPDPNLSSVAPGFPRSESTSSNSDSEDELKDHAKLGLGVFAISKTKEKEFIKSPETPVIFTHHSPKTDTSIKLEKYTAITDDVRAKTGSDTIHTPQINPVPESQWATMSLGISRFRKRHEITSTSDKTPTLPSSAPTISLSSSSSDKGRRTRRKRGEVEMQGVILTKSSLMAENSVEFTPPKIEETFGPGFGIPLFRRHPDLKISERSPVTPPLLLQQQQRGSSSSIDSEDASVKYLGKRWEGISQLPVVTNKEASQIQTYLHTNQAVSIDLDLSHSQSSEVGDKFDSVQLRTLSQRETSPSSSSNSDNETNDHSVPYQSLGWHMEIKASSPDPDNPSSSSSEDDNKVTANQTVHESAMSGMTDDGAPLTYKPVIFKESPPLSNSVSYSSPTRDHSIQRHSVVSITEQGLFHGVDGKGLSIPPKGVSSMSFDEVLRKRIEQSRQATHVNASSEISWTGTSHDLSISSVMRHWNMGSSTPTSEPLDSSNCSRNASDDKSKQDSGEADGMQMHKDTVDSSPGRRNEIWTDRSEYRRTWKGLSAIKAMSSERQKWDTKAENLDRSASPLFDDPGQQAGTRFNYPRSKDLKPLPKQPQTQSRLSSASADESRSPDQLYDIPHYRSHHIGPPQEAPPPIPATSPPDESVGPTLGSEQSSQKQVLEWTRSYPQQSSNTVESDPSSDVSQNQAAYFYSSHNISHV